LFPKATELDLEFRKDWPELSLQTLSVFIDISRIVKMKICSKYFDQFNENTWMDMGIFMKQAQNLSSLIIFNEFQGDQLDRTVENIHSILPYHVKNLQVPLNDVNQIKMILERCEKLTTINFTIDDEEFSDKVMKWFADNTIYTTCRQGYKNFAVWLGKKTFQSCDVCHHHKRIKRTNND
jgi:hypothetical protein